MARTAEFDITMLKHANCVCVAAVFKKAWWKKVGGYNPAMRSGYEDWDFWISLAERGARGRVIAEPLFNYRRHGRTMLVDAQIQHNLLYARIKENHPLLFQKGKWKKPRVTYRVLNPHENIPRPSATTVGTGPQGFA